VKGAEAARAAKPPADILGSPDADEASDEPGRTTLALNPMIGLRGDDLIGAAQVVMRALVTQPTVAAASWTNFVGSLAKIVTGAADEKPDPRDKRFADPTWTKSRPHAALWQTYAALGSAVNEFVEKAELSNVDRRRARLASSILIDALAPSNMLLVNPTAMRQIVDTDGESLIRGANNFVSDLINNGGLPATVDKSKFQVGKNLATSEGACVWRSDIAELLQFAPQSAEVQSRPLIIVPPQINKYYALDLSPDKSLVQYLTRNGFQTFCLSWRNPTPAQRNWGLENYVQAVDAAVDAARAITGAQEVNILGTCSGGITATSYLGYLAGKGERKVNGLVLAVCVLDMSTTGEMQLDSLITPETLRAAREASSLKGVLEGSELARVFAWMRPNDLIWNYWVNNYLLGNQPPAFDILYWNADTTRLPARLHADYLGMIETNPFVNAGKLTLNGVKIDLKRVPPIETYVVGGTTDHITPWKSCYKSARLLGPDTTFVLSNSGHLQSLLNPPGNPKAFFVAGPAKAQDPDAWAAGGVKQSGSWWAHWAEWLGKRSGEKRAAPSKLGGERFPVIAPAPGAYVYET
jgi:polyhydroxyalkanoate synthase subunit PhaC